MMKQISILLIMCVVAQTIFAQIPTVQSFKKDVKKPTVVVKGNKIDTTIVVKGETPLYIVDGKEINNINDISPNDIEKIDVLKGESAKSLYGQKGEKGVVVITTKKKNNTSPNKVEKSNKEVTVTVRDKAYKTLKDNKEEKKENDTEEEKINVLIEGDKIIINGEEVEENDPRINGQGKNGIILKRMQEPDKNKKRSIIVEGQPLDMNGEFDVNGLTLASPVKTNAAFLGVISEENELGAKINEVSEGSPAEKAGLHEGDIITNINDIKISGPKDLYEAIGKFKPADKVQISILKKGIKTKLTAELAKAKPQVFSFSTPNEEMNLQPNINPSAPKSRGNNGLQRGNNRIERFGFELPQISEFNNIFGTIEKPKLGISVEDIEESEGVKIASVSDDSPAAKAGLKENDIITQINDKKVKDVDGIKPIIKAATEGTVFKFNITRNGKNSIIEVKIPKKLKTADL
jgi:serine protease Do